MKLDRLYKTTAKGAIQIIDMEIIGDTYTRTWGQLDGKQQSKSTTAKPKNVGRANETTAEEQALLEAKAVWTKKQKTGYSLNAEAPTTVLLPMKLNDYHKHKSKIKFPCFTSPKLNGVNVEYRLVDGVLKLLSRGGEEYPIPPHQKKDVLNLLTWLDTTSINGEMYCHGEHLQDIMAATKKHNDLTPRLKCWVFDFPAIEGSYNIRCTYAYNKVADPVFAADTCPLINVGLAYSHEQLKEQHDEVVAAGYEGIVIRNKECLYEYNKRSLNAFKFKETKDAEFKVTDFNIDKNNHAVYVCETTEGKAFKVKRKGTTEERNLDAINAKDNIGKYLTVEFETYSKDNVPLKGIGLSFRECDNEGNPVE